VGRVESDDMGWKWSSLGHKKYIKGVACGDKGTSSRK